MAIDFQEKLSEARDRLDADEAQAAFQALRWVFDDTGFATRRNDFVEALRLLERIARVIAGRKFARDVKKCRSRPDDPQALYDLATVFMEQGESDVAACLLVRAHGLVPNEEVILITLVDALQDGCRHRKAYAILKRHVVRHQPSAHVRCLLAFHAVMSADIEGAGQALAELRSFSDEDSRMMTNRVAAMLERADDIGAVSDLGVQDLRAWHYVVTGGLLLQLSPYGFDDGMNGRYAFTSDSYDRCREGLMRMKAALDGCGIAAERVLSLPERGSEIMALAAGRILNVAVERWTPSTRQGLVVAYDLGDLDDATATALYEHCPDQVLFDHASCWTSPRSWAGDLTTYLYQHQSSPWGEHLRFENDQTVTVPPDDSQPEVIATHIVESELEEGALADIDQLRSLASATGRRAAVRQPSGTRSRLWSGPVMSSRFA